MEKISIFVYVTYNIFKTLNYIGLIGLIETNTDLISYLEADQETNLFLYWFLKIGLYESFKKWLEIVW